MSEAMGPALDRACVGLILLQPGDDKVLYVGDAARRLLGFDSERQLGIPDLLSRISMREIGPESTKRATDHPVSRALAGSTAMRTVCEVQGDPENPRREIELSYGNLVENGGCSGIAFLLLEASRTGGERSHWNSAFGTPNSKNAETSLRQSEERYRAFVEQSTEGIWRLEVYPPIATDLPVDVQAELMAERCRIAECNDAMAQMYGLSKASELVGRSWKSIHVENDSLNLDGLRRFVSSGYRTTESESHDVTESGEVKYFSNNAIGMVEEGSLVRIWGTQRDITQARLAEHALRESEARFSRAFNSAPVVIAISRLSDGTCIDINETFVRITGFSRDEVIGRTAHELGTWIIPEEVSQIRRVLSQTTYVRDVEVTQRMKSGEVRYFVLSADIIELGGEDCIISVGVDITDRKRADAERSALLASEKAARLEAEEANRYRTELLAREQSARAQAEAAWLEWQQTFDAMAEEVALVDTEGRLLRANKAFYAWWGKTAEECAGKPLHEVAHSNAKDAADCAICELRNRGERAAIEFPPGAVSERPLYVAIDPIVDSSGATVGFVQQIKDLSDLYQARAQAERERTSLNAIIEQMAEGLIVCDENGVVTRANGLAQDLFGFSWTEFVSDQDGELPQGRFADLQGQPVRIEDLPLQRALTERRVIEGRFWYTKPDEDRILLSVVSSPFLNDQGELRGAVALIRDVTEQQREHDHFQQVDKMRALGQLSSGVAHNFNNSLASILGYTQLALRKAEGSELEKYLGIIQKSAEDAARMVERIQNFSRSRPRSGDFRSVRLADAVRDAVEIARPRWRNDAQSLGIKYEVRVDWVTRDDLLIEGEQSELREVFLNIILNALDAMPSGGSLVVYATDNRETVAVNFSDTGNGMTPEIKQRVFEPFFTTKGMAGLGLGLSESYRIIERHGGRIEIESQLRHGTTFTVILPVSKTATEPLPEVKESNLKMQALRILVLDDEVFVRGALSAMLTELGHATVEASSAREAVDLARQQTFDLVFTDLAMPEIDGIAAAAMLKSANTRVKVILMSGYGSDKASDRAQYSTSVDAVISKPFSFSEIRQVVLQVFPS